MTIARQRLAKRIPERYAVDKNRRPLLDIGFGYNAVTSVSDTTYTCELEHLKAVSSIRFARSY